MTMLVLRTGVALSPSIQTSPGEWRHKTTVEQRGEKVRSEIDHGDDDGDGFGAHAADGGG